MMLLWLLTVPARLQQPGGHGQQAQQQLVAGCAYEAVQPAGLPDRR